MTSATRSRFLDLPGLAALEHMRFTTRQRNEGQFGGRHRSLRHGGAGEFVDFREYSGGEDLRRLDWKVFARTGKAFVRLHQDETNLRVLLAIDSSGSMNFGQRGGTKLEYAQFLTTALSHVISRTQDHVGVAVLGEKVRDFLPPGGTPMHLTRVQEAIEAIEPASAPQMGQTLRDLFTVSPRRGVLVVVSDFLMDDLEEVAAAWRLFRHRNWDVVALHLVHPEEERLPLGTALRFLDMEGGGQIDCSPAELAAGYEQRVAAHLDAVRQLALVCGCDYRLVSTGVPYLRTLQSFLVERAG